MWHDDILREHIIDGGAPWFRKIFNSTVEFETIYLCALAMPSLSQSKKGKDKLQRYLTNVSHQKKLRKYAETEHGKVRAVGNERW